MNNFKLEFLNKLILSEYEEKRTISKKLNKYASKVVDFEKSFLSTLSTKQQKQYHELSFAVDEYQLESVIDYINFTITFIIDFYNFFKW